MAPAAPVMAAAKKTSKPVAVMSSGPSSWSSPQPEFGRQLERARGSAEPLSLYVLARDSSGVRTWCCAPCKGTPKGSGLLLAAGCGALWADFWLPPWAWVASVSGTRAGSEQPDGAHVCAQLSCSNMMGLCPLMGHPPLKKKPGGN